MSRCSSLAAAAALFTLSACATRVGPTTIPAARFDYNQTITRSLNEQLLLNLVRVRYRDTPLFIDVGSVIAQYQWAGNVNASPTVSIDGSDKNQYGFGVGGNYSESPTITYEPVRGAAAARRLLSPIDPATLALLSESGWSIERLLLCCVQEINGVANARSATGPAPSSVPDNRGFRELAARMRRLQTEGLLHVRPYAEGERTGVRILVKQGAASPELAALREQLGLAPGVASFRVTPQTDRRGEADIAVAGRSLLGVLFFLSLAVEPPDQHARDGLVGAADLDWSPVIGSLLRVRSSNAEPGRAFVRIRYRGTWFYIDDSDLESKTTFNLLTYLYSLQAAGAEGGSPLLTVPVG